MKPTIPTHDSDTIQWFIIGAHQAGASENEIASLASLPKFTVHNTVTSFKKTGSPTMKKQKRKKRTSKMEKSHSKTLDIGIQDASEFKGRFYQNKLYSVNQKRKPTATDTIDYILNKARLYQEKHISSTWKSQKQQDYGSNTIGLSSSSPILPTPTTPTVNLHQPNFSTEKNFTSSPSHPSLLSKDHNYNNSVQKINFWSRKDDKILLNHVLTRMGCWHELDQLFEGRHSIMDCKQRWNTLQHYLFKQLKKNGTNGW